jgi:hypothetical protein
MAEAYLAGQQTVNVTNNTTSYPTYTTNVTGYTTLYLLTADSSITFSKASWLLIFFSSSIYLLKPGGSISLSGVSSTNTTKITFDSNGTSATNTATGNGGFGVYVMPCS